MSWTKKDKIYRFGYGGLVLLALIVIPLIFYAKGNKEIMAEPPKKEEFKSFCVMIPVNESLENYDVRFEKIGGKNG